ncbi:ABC transporter substrate-binding protein [Halofilum ochraceum]|uniref:ABC transporter substrate-binding protein n=1 Tax=Halofilum ochraceum TaxID=1611323 RepID=UPI001586BC05|nr:ABC transporter substrate-binding protein [Halofilum ochraceum]
MKWLQVTLAGFMMLAVATTASAARVVVGSTNFAEQLILANIYAEVLEDRGVEVEKRLNLGSREIVYPALTSGEIDILPEYTGSLLAYLSEGGEIPARESDAVARQLREALPDGLELLEPADAQNKNTLVVRPETAEKHDLETFSDLAAVSGDMIVGGPPEMKTRKTGLEGLKDVYGIEFAQFRPLDAGGPVTVGALENGDIDVARMFTTQGVIDARGWVVLADDKGLEPAQNLVPVARAEVLNDTIRGALNEISANLSDRDLQQMNRAVGIDEREPEDVAREWVRDNGLVDD